MKKIICLFKGHIWQRWLWAEERDYACKNCSRCGKVGWGATKEYFRTYPGAFYDKNPEIIDRLTI